MPNLNNKVLHNITVFYSKLDAQVEIADCLDAPGRKMVNQERKQQSLMDLFRTLLHQLMTAQIRVHDVDLDELIVFKGVRQWKHEIEKSVIGTDR